MRQTELAKLESGCSPQNLQIFDIHSKSMSPHPSKATRPTSNYFSALRLPPDLPSLLFTEDGGVLSSSSSPMESQRFVRGEFVSSRAWQGRRGVEE